ncbi:MAG: Gldg family protein [Oscillospiraceae bacterium]|nr:Gldg family protein [Oscillospiraceae bacterium]
MANETVKPQKEKKPFNKKKLKYGTVATVITVVFIAVVVVINLIAGVLTDRKDLKLDLTKEKYYEVSQDTIDYIQDLKTDVEIAVMAKESDFATSGTYMKMVLETLEKYEQHSDHIKINFYDVASNPDVVTKFSANYNGEISEGNIVVASGERVKVLTVNSLFNMQSDYYSGSSSVTSYKGEQELTSAIMSVTDANPQRVAFISKYNGSAIYHSDNAYSISALYSLMDKNGYEVSEVDIMTDTLSPEDYDMAVLPAPVNDLSEDSIKKLDDFLYNNGDLDKDMIYIADVLQYATPNIDDFLEVWGIEIGGSIVYDSSSDKSQYVTTMKGQLSAPVATIAEDTYSEGLSNTKLPIIVPLARPVNLLFDANVDRNTTALLTTSDTSFLYPLEMQTAEEAKTKAEAAENGEEETEEETEETTEFDPDNAEKSAQTVMAVATKTNMDSNNTAHVNNVMVIGGATILDQVLTYSNTYNNAEYVINAVNKMCGKENGIIIAEKDLSVQTIDITSSQIKAISRTVIFIIPLIVVAAGIVVFLRRRNR